MRPVPGQHVELMERAFVQQHGQPLSRRQLALGVLCVDAVLSPTKFRLLF